jgi:hypothetical protein
MFLCRLSGTQVRRTTHFSRSKHLVWGNLWVSSRVYSLEIDGMTNYQDNRYSVGGCLVVVVRK